MPKRKWDKFAIKAELHRQGWTFTALGERFGCHRTNISVALDRPNSTGEKAISWAIGVPAEELWPDRYPKSATSHRIYDSRRHGPCTSQKVATLADNEAAA
ncbi:helix-turn-helix domain-containing protein [uncultured Cohaesibacter sp.]|jgi:Ner family transcriptional regulator|uniref:helix-turn-helix domain-containing protein n=1 Tax=uncultured Cohaesibacter sp. TaxID=1002546 RepID=UPI002AAB4610|nr:helix-turn-helix domain-containing protein [uncultured Cohaesibacter sp.]